MAAPSKRSPAITAEQLEPGRAFSEEEKRQRHGEERLGLQHQRGQPRRHAEGHGQVEEAIKRDAKGQPIAHYQLPFDLGRLDEKHQRHGGDEKAQGGGKQRRESLDAELDDGEVEAPDRYHEQGQHDIADGHQAVRQRASSDGPKTPSASPVRISRLPTISSGLTSSPNST
jgi:hypothetical protein